MANNLTFEGKYSFTNVDFVTIQHNLDSENVFFSIISKGDVVTDKILKSQPSLDNPKNILEIYLKEVVDDFYILVYTKDILPSNFINSELRKSVQKGDENIYRSFFRKTLEENGQYTTEEITDGFISSIFEDEESLPTEPEDPTKPTFAMISEVITDGAKLAYWDYWNQTGWVVTEYPWISPQFEPLFVVDKSFIPSGNSNWNFTMGTFFQAVAPGKIINGSIYLGANGQSTHSWQLLKSTAVQSTRPANATFTNILEQGVVTVSSPSSWTDVDFQNEYVVTPNEWYMMIFCVFQGGTSYNISSTRGAGNLNEDILRVDAGCYISTAGPNPGVPLLPTNAITSTCYGVVNLQTEGL